MVSYTKKNYVLFPKTMSIALDVYSMPNIIKTTGERKQLPNQNINFNTSLCRILTSYLINSEMRIYSMQVAWRLLKSGVMVTPKGGSDDRWRWRLSAGGSVQGQQKGDLSIFAFLIFPLTILSFLFYVTLFFIFLIKPIIFIYVICISAFVFCL